MTGRATAGAPRHTYAIGDVHGRLDLLDAAIEAIARHAAHASFRMIMLGDYIDRGPDSRGVIDRLMTLEQAWDLVCLKGNHEVLMTQALLDPSEANLSVWLANGGVQTLASYGLEPDDDLLSGVPEAHLRWLCALPSTARDPHRIYVHAGLAPGKPLERQKDATLLWIREAFLRAPAEDFEVHVVHGHTPLWKGKPDPAAPERLDHRTNLDTAAFATGVLSIGVFRSDETGGPVEVLQVVGPPRPHAIIDYQQRMDAYESAGRGGISLVRAP